MSTTDDFIKKYKLLDKLCKEMYMSDKGVTSYIDDMKSVPFADSKIIEGWRDDLYKLIELRGKRNKWAHDDDVVNFSRSDCTWIEDFHKRVLKGNDPLALLRKHQKMSNKVKSVNAPKKTKKRKKSRLKSFLWRIALIAGMVLLVYCLLKKFF